MSHGVKFRLVPRTFPKNKGLGLGCHPKGRFLYKVPFGYGKWPLSGTPFFDDPSQFNQLPFLLQNSYGLTAKIKNRKYDMANI